MYFYSLRTKGTYEHTPNPLALFDWPSQHLIGVAIQVSYFHGEWIFFVLSNSYELVPLQRYQNDQECQLTMENLGSRAILSHTKKYHL